MIPEFIQNWPRTSNCYLNAVIFTLLKDVKLCDWMFVSEMHLGSHSWLFVRRLLVPLRQRGRYFLTQLFLLLVCCFVLIEQEGWCKDTCLTWEVLLLSDDLRCSMCLYGSAVAEGLDSALYLNLWRTWLSSLVVHVPLLQSESSERATVMESCEGIMEGEEQHLSETLQTAADVRLMWRELSRYQHEHQYSFRLSDCTGAHQVESSGSGFRQWITASCYCSTPLGYSICACVSMCVCSRGHKCVCAAALKVNLRDERQWRLKSCTLTEWI